MLIRRAQILDFAAARDGMPVGQRGRRIVVNTEGEEIVETAPVELGAVVEAAGESET